MDAGFLTAMRTGAASGVATKYLAKEDARKVGVFGAGVQARTQLWAMCTIREIDEVIVYDLDSVRALKWANEMSEKHGISVRPVEAPREAVEGMDIIITASSATEPIFDGHWLSPGTHINGVGSHAPKARELDTHTMVRSKIIPDLRSACLTEAGDLLIPISEGALCEEDIGPDLGEVVAGIKPGRERDEEITLFKSVGLAIQDVSTASHVYRLAIEKGIGKKFQF
jgi:alanine dehydrogenase